MSKSLKRRTYITQLLIVIDSWYLPLDEYFDGGKFYQISHNWLFLNKGIKIQDGCQTCPMISATKLISLALSTALKQFVLL